MSRDHPPAPRPVRRRSPPAAIACWIVGQALINIGVVIGLAPVIGVPLPLVSAGGSALIMTMAALGVLISFARHGAGRRGGARRPAGRRPAVARRARACRAGYAPMTAPDATVPGRVPGRCRSATGEPRRRCVGAARRRRDRRPRQPAARGGRGAAAPRPRDARSRCSAPPTGLEARLVPERGLPLAARPARAAAAPTVARPAAAAGAPAPPRCGPPATRSTGPARRSSSASAATSSTPAYLAARRRGLPVVVHEANARPGLANRLGARWARRGRGDVPRHAAARRAGRRACRCAPPSPAGSRPARRRPRGARGRRGRGRSGSTPDRPTRPGHRRQLGAVRLNAAVAGGRRGPRRARAPRCCTYRRRQGRRGRGTPCAAGDVAAHYHVREYLSEMELAYAVASLVVCRSGAGDRVRARRARPARRLRAAADRQRRAAAQRRAAGRGRRRAAGGRRRPDPAWLRAHVAAAARGPGRGSTPWARPPRRPARSTAPPGSRTSSERPRGPAMTAARPGRPVSARYDGRTAVTRDGVLRADGPRPRAPRRRRRRGHVGDRRPARRPRRRGQRLGRPRRRRSSPRCGTAGVDVHVGHDAAHVADVDTVVVS